MKGILVCCLAAVVLAVFIATPEARAERMLTPEGRQDEATDVVTGRVLGVYHRDVATRRTGEGTIERHFLIEIDVLSVEKGDRFAAGDVVPARAWRIQRHGVRGALPGPGGHFTIPEEGQVVRAWLVKGPYSVLGYEGNGYTVVYPTGIEVVPESDVTPSPLEREAAIVNSLTNLRQLSVRFVEQSTTRRWPTLNGKHFVLSLVVTGAIDRERPEQLAWLFSPGDRERSLDDIDPLRWKDVTMEALKRERDVSDLTSYAGRRNRVRECMITPDQLARGTPILADLSFDGLALVAFSNGTVRRMDREALGLGTEDPIVAGEASSSPVLFLLGDT
ncbi:MAG: hypothetical protein ACYTG6_09055 [Planctomycetota bacterium]|jgi:hypothetical protein